MRNFILDSNKAKKIATGGNSMEFEHFSKRSARLSASGGNFTVGGKKLQIQAKKPYNLVAEISPNSNWLGTFEKIRTEFTQN